MNKVRYTGMVFEKEVAGPLRSRLSWNFAKTYLD